MSFIFHIYRYENVLDAPFQDPKENSLPDTLSCNRFENSIHFASSVPPIAEQDEEPSDGGGSGKDLFGSSPFSSGSFVNPFGSSGSTSNSNNSGVVITKSIASPLKPYQQTSSPLVPHQQAHQSFTDQSEYFSPSQKSLVPNPERCCLESPGSPSDGLNMTSAVNATSSPSAVIPCSAKLRQPSQAQHDLFGAVPFSEMTTQILTRQSQQMTFPRPTTLPLNHVSPVGDTVPKLKSIHRHSCSISSAAVNTQKLEPIRSCNFQENTDSSSPSEANGHKGSNDTSPKLLQRKDKTKGGDRSKYHLIRDCHTSKAEKVNALPSKLSHKSGRSAASSGFKKSSKVSKKAGGEKTSKVLAAGFSNMSFEDFPSDEGDEALTEQTVVPFEVIRGEKHTHDGERRFGSLKRRSTPFS
jgi:AP2-associated kinase